MTETRNHTYSVGDTVRVGTEPLVWTVDQVNFNHTQVRLVYGLAARNVPVELLVPVAPVNIHKRRIVVGRKPYRGPNYSFRIAVVTALFMLGLLAAALHSCGAVR